MKRGLKNSRFRGSVSSKKEQVRKPLGKGKIIFSIILTALIVWLIGLSLQFSSRCEDQNCFDERLKNCHRTTFVGGTQEVVYEYSIEGRSGDFCMVAVELLQGQLNEQNSKILEGKEMTCKIPYGLVIRPESDMKNCHGELKEGLQDIIIENLHSYLIGNLDKINEELKN